MTNLPSATPNPASRAVVNTTLQSLQNLYQQVDLKTLFASLPVNGWLSYAEAELLWRTVNQTQGPILEVGSYFGRSTCLLGATGRPVWAVDPFVGFDSDWSGEQIQQRLFANLQERGLNNVVVTALTIERFILPGSVGFAYLDGDHTYQGTRNQIEKALLGEAAQIGIHDVNDTGGGAEVKRAALELLGPWRERVERLAVWYP